MEDRQSEARTHIAQGFDALGTGRSADAEAAARRALQLESSATDASTLRRYYEVNDLTHIPQQF